MPVWLWLTLAAAPGAWALIACVLGFIAGRLLRDPDPDAAIMATAEEFRADEREMPLLESLAQLYILAAIDSEVTS